MCSVLSRSLELSVRDERRRFLSRLTHSSPIRMESSDYQRLAGWSILKPQGAPTCGMRTGGSAFDAAHTAALCHLTDHLNLSRAIKLAAQAFTQGLARFFAVLELRRFPRLPLLPSQGLSDEPKPEADEERDHRRHDDRKREQLLADQIGDPRESGGDDKEFSTYQLFRHYIAGDIDDPATRGRCDHADDHRRDVAQIRSQRRLNTHDRVPRQRKGGHKLKQPVFEALRALVVDDQG